LKTKMAVGIALVIIGLLGITLFPLSMMGGYRGGYWSTTFAAKTTTGTQYTSLSPTAISLNQAKSIADHFLDSLNNPDLAIKEIMEFEHNFYIIFYEKSTGVGAFEMLIWKVDPNVSGFGMISYGGSVVGSIIPEIGPNMMWNTKYGGMMGQMGGGMMGGGMMGGQQGRTPTAIMPVNEDEAKKIGQQYLDRYFAGATIEGVKKFYGYYTFDFEKDGKIQGMFSVNGYTGQTWYHGWHGSFIREQEFVAQD